jgi:hypothetical protein
MTFDGALGYLRAWHFNFQLTHDWMGEPFELSDPY